MANRCVNGTLEGANYSSPVPVIGLYVAVGSSVCLLFMLFDTISAFRHRQRWIPCGLFSLNSFTLTLLSISSKLPIDLTTPMPSVQDQLSKLTATTLICISMAFLCPSVGNSKDSEYLTNLAALSILVITVVVNICIQIFTGVIHLFIKEHIFIACCMLVLLLLLWFSASNIKLRNLRYRDDNQISLTEMEGSMLQVLKFSYFLGFVNNPQFRACRSVNSSTMSGLSLISGFVLVQATIRSLILKQLKFCGATSDYDWSMWIIVVTQIITVLVGCCATSFRWFSLFRQVKFDIRPNGRVVDGARLAITRYPFLGSDLWQMFAFHVQRYVWHIVWLASILIMVPATGLFNIFGGRMNSDEDGDGSISIQTLKCLIPRTHSQPDNWTLRKVSNNIDRWMDVSETELPKYMPQILSRTKPSEQLYTMQLKDLLYPDQQGFKVTSLTMALLVRIATFCMPGSSLAQSLVDSCGEAYEIVNFIETRLNSASNLSRQKSRVAKAVLIGNGFGCYLPQIIKRSSHGEEYHSQSQLNRALLILEELKNTIEGRILPAEIAAITDFINRQDYETIEALYSAIEKLFADMLHLVLAQLPNAIQKELTESPLEEFEERVRLALKLVSKMESLEAQVHWSFPVDWNISSFVTPQDAISQSRTDCVHVNDSLDSDEEIVFSAHDDVVIQVV